LLYAALLESALALGIALSAMKQYGRIVARQRRQKNPEVVGGSASQHHAALASWLGGEFENFRLRSEQPKK
jgi:hypothetical protein